MKLQPFEYSDTLSEGEFNQHTINLKIQAKTASKIILLRGIVGSVNLTHHLSKTQFKQNIDYLDLENNKSEEDPITRLKNYVSPEISINEFCDYFSDKKFLYQNNSFFERITNEFNNFHYYSNKKSHTTAFIYVYRILESISYAFPLIYATRTDDFIGTYSFLKDCLGNTSEKENTKKELGFFKSFIKNIFEKDPIFADTILIKIAGDTPKIQKIFFDAIKKTCPSEIFDGVDTEDPIQISVKFPEYSSFIINLRNRFFHLDNSGHPNLQSDEILDSDLFFSQLNKHSIRWLSIVIVEVLNFSIGKYNFSKSNNVISPNLNRNVKKILDKRKNHNNKRK